MQKLKREPLLKRASDMLGSFLESGRSLLSGLRLSPDWLTTAASIVLLILLLCALLGCSPRTIRPTLPPQAEPREIPDFQGQTYRDVILYVIELRESAMACEADKGAIRYLFGEEDAAH